LAFWTFSPALITLEPDHKTGLLNFVSATSVIQHYALNLFYHLHSIKWHIQLHFVFNCTQAKHQCNLMMLISYIRVEDVWNFKLVQLILYTNKELAEVLILVHAIHITIIFMKQIIIFIYTEDCPQADWWLCGMSLFWIDNPLGKVCGALKRTICSGR
jgi:hypothetical protein